MTTGRIFNIQRYSLHDGNGIRTIVFLKGCHLRCRWCCNPESQRYEVETMENETIGRDITVAEVMAMVERDRHYYRRSGGGLTLSGGEALAQPDFAHALLQAAHESGIHTAIESTAIVGYGVIEKILPYLDEFLMDIKHMNAAKHKEFTSKENTIALENAKRIAQSSQKPVIARNEMTKQSRGFEGGQGQTELIIRVPVIPGFNATVQEITDIAKFAATLPGVKEIHLLPYHNFGEGKYTALGRSYPMGDVKPPPSEEMQGLKQAVENATKLRCRIGG